MMPLENFLKPTQEQLFQRLCKLYKGRTVAEKGKYLLVKGKAPVMLVAHLDTVHKEPVSTICASQQGTILMAPQGIGGDDRCGVYALASLWETSAVAPWLLFTCDEENGGHGARAFADAYFDGSLPKGLEQMKMLIEIDRKGQQDAVYYNCGNEEFEDYITSKGFKTAYGSFSDISIIAPAMNVAAVNLSAGYYNAHTLHEYINRRHLHSTVRKVRNIIEEVAKDNIPRFEYVENIYDDSECYGHIALPRNLPKKYHELYDMLLDYFPPKEIEIYRRTYGDAILSELYASAYGF